MHIVFQVSLEAPFSFFGKTAAKSSCCIHEGLTLLSGASQHPFDISALPKFPHTSLSLSAERQHTSGFV
jgi:hypothetical protein